MSKKELKEDVVTLEENRVSPIVFDKSRGPRLGVEVFLPKDNIVFRFYDGRDNVPVDFVPPIATKLVKEGGANYRLEFYFPKGTSVPFEKFDGKTFFLQTGVNEENGKKKGRLFKNLVCTGRLYGTLKEFLEVKLDKYVCHTSNLVHFEGDPKSLKGLAAPYERV